MILSNYSFIESIYYGWGKQPDDLFRLKDKPSTQRVYLGKSEDLEKLYDQNFCKDFDLSTMKKVFFDSNCTYPRYKLANFTNVKRCLSPDKADAVIVSKTKFSTEYSKYYVFYSPTHDHYYLMSAYSMDRASLRNTYKDEKSTLDVLALKYLISKNMVSEDSVYKGYTDVVMLSDNDEKSINVLNGTHKFILDSDLDNAISKGLNTVDESDIESIDELLASSDVNTVGLGMDLLINYNVLDRACTIGMMLFKHNTNILRCSKINSVGFKNILSSLNITKSDLSYYNENGKLHYINKLYKLTTNEDDKKMAYKMAVSIVQKQLEDSFSSMSDVVNNLGIKAEIKAY